jgi:hypothetical protein
MEPRINKDIQKKNTILEAKSIQKLQAFDQEIFLQLFYAKIRDVFIPLISDRLLGEYIPQERCFDGLPIDEIDQLQNLIKSIRSIKSPTLEYKQDSLFDCYLETQNNLQKCSQIFKDKRLFKMFVHDEKTREFLEILCLILKQYFNLVLVYEINPNFKTNKKIPSLLDELQDLYNNPEKCIIQFERQTCMDKCRTPFARATSNNQKNPEVIYITQVTSFMTWFKDTMKKYPRVCPISIVDELRRDLLHTRNEMIDINRVHFILYYFKSVLELDIEIEKHNRKDKASAKALGELSLHSQVQKPVEASMPQDPSVISSPQSHMGGS